MRPYMKWSIAGLCWTVLAIALTALDALAAPLDAETFIWWIVPLLATISGAVYAARKDAGLEMRVRSLEQCESHRQGAESGGSSEGPDLLSSVIDLGVAVGMNTKAVEAHGERLDELEKDDD